MIRKLYWQIVLIFFGSVILSLILAFSIADNLYKQSRIDEISGQMNSLAGKIISSYQKGDKEQGKQYLELLATLQVKAVLYKADGSILYSSASQYPKEDTVKKVLSGGVYRLKPKIPPAGPPYAGYPFKAGNERYALFVSPSVVGIIDDFRKALLGILGLILLTGSILFLITSRFITRPIQEMTIASQRLAKGDFSVSLQSRRKDELGNLTANFNRMAQELGELDEMRKQFVADVSHEIQSPLTSIGGFARALRDGVIDGEKEKNEYLEIIERESKRLSVLSQNLLKLAALDQAHPPFHPEPFDLDEHLRRTAAVLEPIWEEKNQSVRLDLRSGEITGDKEKLSQVWINLISNAVRYTHEGGSIAIASKQDDNYAYVDISDNGEGIPKEDLDKIFTRFFKSDRARTREKGGSGLGLSIVKRIVDLHQGDIQMKSELGKGTIVSVMLPLNKKDSGIS